MINLKMTVNGVQVLDRSLVAFSERAADLLPAFEQVADLFAVSEQQQFDTEGSYGSGSWSPLAPSTVAHKLLHFPGTKILERTGALRDSLTKRPFSIEQITGRGIRVGTSISYAKYHQTGTPRMPRRPPIGVPEVARRSMVKIIQHYIRYGI